MLLAINQVPRRKRVAVRNLSTPTLETSKGTVLLSPSKREHHTLILLLGSHLDSVDIIVSCKCFLAEFGLVSEGPINAAAMKELHKAHLFHVLWTSKSFA